MKLGQNSVLNVEAISTVPCFGYGSGNRRGASGTDVEIFGPESSGKTTVALHIVAEAQKMGARRFLSTWNTLWIPFTPRPWE